MELTPSESQPFRRPGEPIITHGHTLCTSISFASAVTAVRDAAAHWLSCVLRWLYTYCSMLDSTTMPVTTMAVTTTAVLPWLHYYGETYYGETYYGETYYGCTTMAVLQLW